MRQKILIPLADDGLPHYGFVSLKQILIVVPLSKSEFLHRVQAGIYPRPYRIGQRNVAWKVEDVRAIIASFVQVTPDTIRPNIAAAIAAKAAKRRELV